MTSFWLAALFMALVAVGFVFWPVILGRGKGQEEVDREGMVLDLFNEHMAALEQQLKNGEVDQDQFQQLKQELELSLLEDAPEDSSHGSMTGKWPLWSAGLLLPILAVYVYWERGNIDDVEIVQVRDAYFQQSAAAIHAGDASTPIALEALVSSLEKRLLHKPDNTGNRYLLARSYMQQSEYVKAAAEYLRLIQQEEALEENGQSRVPANIVGELAQAVFLAAGNKVTPEVQQLVDKALEKDPNEPTALGLAGIGAFEKQDYSSAIRYWGRAVQLLGPGSGAAQSLRAGMARARDLLAEQGSDVAEAGKGDGQKDVVAADSQVARLKVLVELGGDVPVAPTDTLFVYARAWNGAKLPLAIQRLSAAQLPMTIELDESMAMAPGMTITSVDQLEVVARLSSTGDPIAKSGDWQAAQGPVELGQLEEPLTLVISEQIP